MNNHQQFWEKLSVPQQQWLKRVIGFVSLNLQDPHFTISRIAEEFYLSERQFHRRIKRWTGMTANQFVTCIRMKKAKDLLESGKFTTLKEVALRVGYCRAEYLSKLYKKHYGERPSHFFEPAS